MDEIDTLIEALRTVYASLEKLKISKGLSCKSQGGLITTRACWKMPMPLMTELRLQSRNWARLWSMSTRVWTRQSNSTAKNRR